MTGRKDGAADMDFAAIAGDEGENARAEAMALEQRVNQGSTARALDGMVDAFRHCFNSYEMAEAISKVWAAGAEHGRDVLAVERLSHADRLHHRTAVERVLCRKLVEVRR